MEELKKRVQELEKISDAQTLTINIVAQWVINNLGKPRNPNIADLIGKFSVQYVLDNKEEVLATLV